MFVVFSRFPVGMAAVLVSPSAVGGGSAGSEAHNENQEGDFFSYPRIFPNGKDTLNQKKARPPCDGRAID